MNDPNLAKCCQLSAGVSCCDHPVCLLVEHLRDEVARLKELALFAKFRKDDAERDAYQARASETKMRHQRSRLKCVQCGKGASEGRKEMADFIDKLRERFPARWFSSKDAADLIHDGAASTIQRQNVLIRLRTLERRGWAEQKQKTYGAPVFFRMLGT